MTLEEYLERYAKTTNELLILIGQPPITADTLREKGITVNPCSCGALDCPGWGLFVPTEAESPKN